MKSKVLRGGLILLVLVSFLQAVNLEDCTTIDNSEIPDEVRDVESNIIAPEDMIREIDKYEIIKDDSPFLVPDEKDFKMSECLDLCKEILQKRIEDNYLQDIPLTHFPINGDIEVEEKSRVFIDTGSATLPVAPVFHFNEPDASEDKISGSIFTDPSIQVHLKEKFQNVVYSNDSLTAEILRIKDSLFLVQLTIFDSMRVYKKEINEMLIELDDFKRDSVVFIRKLSTLNDSLVIYSRRNTRLLLENESLWTTIDQTIKDKILLHDEINKLHLTVSEQKRKLIPLENKLAQIAPYSVAHSYFGFNSNIFSRSGISNYGYEGEFGFGGLGITYRRRNLLGLNSFRKVELDFFGDMFETRKETDINVSAGMWMYPWMLPWLSQISPELDVVIDSTDFYIAMNYYTKSYMPPLSDDDEDLFSFTLGIKTYVPQRQTGFELLVTNFEEDYKFSAYTLGFQYRLFESQANFLKPTIQENLLITKESEDNILLNCEVFASYRENHFLPSPFSDGFHYSGFQESDYDKFIGVGLTWGGNRYSYLPNLHNRLARNSRFDIMDIFPINSTNVQMFGLYLYAELKDDGTVERVSGDAIYHLPQIPLFECPILMRVGIHDNGTGRWLERTTSNSLALTGYTGLNPLEPSPKNLIEADLWLMFERVPICITFDMADPANEFPMEIGINTFFNLH